MSIEVLVAMTSIAGAALFAGAGYLFAIWRGGIGQKAQSLANAHSEVAQTELRATRAEEDLARFRQQASELSAKLRAESEERERARDAVERERAGAQRLEARLVSSERERTELERALADARKGAAGSALPEAKTNDPSTDRELARVKQELLRIKGERDRARSELSRLERQTEEARTARRGLEEERDHSARELDSAAQRLEDHEASAREAATTIDALRSELSVHEGQSTRLRGDLESSRQDVAMLRRELVEMKDLRGEMLVAKKEIAALRAQGFRASIPPKVDADSDATIHDGLSYQQLVDRLASAERAKSAAITDDMGFVVAGTGDHAEALAAFGVFIAEAGARAAEFFPMHQLGRVTVEDAFGVCLTARPIEHRPAEEVELMLVTLGVSQTEPLETATRQ